MKRILIVLLIGIVMFLVAAPAFSEQWELGISVTPVPGKEEDNMLAGFHFGYKWWYIWYATWDSIVLPPWIIQDWTGYVRPGFLNMFDAGVHLNLGPFIGYTELGVNYLYLYKQAEDNIKAGGGGVNLRVGAGLKFNWWGLNLSGTAVFPSFSDLGRVLKGLVSEKTRELAFDALLRQLVPSINLVLYL